MCTESVWNPGKSTYRRLHGIDWSQAWTQYIRQQSAGDARMLVTWDCTGKFAWFPKVRMFISLKQAWLASESPSYGTIVLLLSLLVAAFHYRKY